MHSPQEFSDHRIDSNKEIHDRRITFGQLKDDHANKNEKAHDYKN